VVLDAIGMSDIDFTGSVALREVLDEMQRRGVAFGVARAAGRLRDGLARSGLFDRVGGDRFFDSVGEAVSALAP
jgi:SulP family sulfate permease